MVAPDIIDLTKVKKRKEMNSVRRAVGYILNNHGNPNPEIKEKLKVSYEIIRKNPAFLTERNITRLAAIHDA